MVDFLDNLLKSALAFPADRELGIERAHRALVPKPNNPQAKPRSIVVKFGSYRTKEEVIRRAWQKKEVFCNAARFYVDHDFPPEVLKRRGEYAEAKKVLKEKRIKFQTPYPARMRVFYDDGTRLYQDATEATRDMVSRGFSVSVVKSPNTTDQEEIALLSTWQMAGRRRERGGDQESGAADGCIQFKKTARSQYKEKLQKFRK
ncbi:LINE-1 type transposase domain-containing protein 1 [Anabarilius grahami]|uniref:LINE-1 type transposase domain-containing protein 1 n=1 Tax=Anabarilius grahami TaxID=495550 RepID=A0A3N0XPM2_ANAGA|nr:LINE-1 type transposase domain-containing protein 1 [Anabarilius grahami]